MRSVSKPLLDSWYELLNGNLTGSVPVYITSVPANSPDKYVWLYTEDETTIERNSTAWIKNVVVVSQIVTVFKTAINPDEADDIFNEICVLVANGPYHNHNLPAQAGIKINGVEDEQTVNLQEDDGTYKVFRKITRYNHLITIQS